MLVRFARLILTAVVAVSLGSIGLRAQQQKNWKDRAEYDLYDSITKATDASKRLALLNEWTQKYPTSDYEDIRLENLLVTYQQLNRPADVLKTAGAILGKDPKNLRARSMIVYFIFAVAQPGAEELDLAQRASQGLLADLDEYFAASKKPATVSDADWQKQRNELEVLANNALGYTLMQKKDNDGAEKAFTRSLQINPANGQVSYWLGTVILAQRKPEKQSAALYHFARASVYDGPGAMNPQGRQQVLAYLDKTYVNFHGDKSGLEEIKALAKDNPFPPADFKVKSAAEVAFENEEKLRQTNPQLALWLNIKRELSQGGPQYFDERLKNAAVPKLRGRVVSQTPAARPTQVVLAMSDESTPEATLKLSAAMPNPAEVGTEVQFEGVPTEFVREPFMVVFEVEKEQLEGWPAPARPAAAPKKATPRKKK